MGVLGKPLQERLEGFVFLEFLLRILWWGLFGGAAGAYVAAFVVGFFGGANGDSAGVACVNELEFAFCGIDFGDDSYVSYALANGASVEEYEVAGAEVMFLNGVSVVDLRAR